MLITTQNCINSTIHNQTAFRGLINTDNVKLAANAVGASYYTDFDPLKITRPKPSPAEQICEMVLPGGKDFEVRYSVSPSASLNNASSITATASINGDSADGLTIHLHDRPHKFGENLARATKRAAISLAIRPFYVKQRADFVTELIKKRGYNLQGLSAVCSELQGQDKHIFLTRLLSGVAAKSKGNKDVQLAIDAKKLTVTIGEAVHSIKRPFFRNEAKVLVDRLLKLL